MGVSLSTANRAHMAYERGGIKALKPKPIGGPRRENITLSEEMALLARFSKAAGAGGMSKLDLYADRTSTATMRANQLRLWFASMAYVLLCALRRIGLHDTDFATAACGTLRLKLLKIGAIVRVSARRIEIAMASACPVARDWACAAIRLAIAALARASPA
jgi:hypothetical protein